MKRLSGRKLIRRIALVFLMGLIVPPAGWGSPAGDTAPGRKMARQATREKRFWSTVDHTRHEALKQAFKSGDDITRACVSCHSTASDQLHKSIHWTWTGPETKSGAMSGKGGDSLNNFCISANRMEDKNCSACHTGWNGKEGEVNCLVCHAKEKFNFKEAFADYEVFKNSDDPEEQELAGDVMFDIQAAAQQIGRPLRRNCGSCHFYGGGGDGVKHGDLDTSLTKPGKSLDVHMGVDGEDFECVRCHTTTEHNIAGRVYTEPAATDRRSLIEDDLASKITCESCHTAKPHRAGSKPNDHTDKVACQSCHIPTYARVLPTKMSWDWSTSGKLKDGKHWNEEGPLGRHTYMSKKGTMTWAKDVVPEYDWFNGVIHTLTAKDIVDPAKVVPVSRPEGDPSDPNARIYPFKVHRGKQPYDTENNTLLAPLLSGKNGYWATVDWNDAISRGSALVDVPFSGSFDFVETSYVFPITHMVAPGEDSVSCVECHKRKEGRLEGLAGVYMPGRDTFKTADAGGWGMVLASLLGVLVHGIGRFISRNGKGC